MNKSSSMYLFECYIWLVNTIARGPISRAAIDDKWARASVNDYKTDSIPECTFHRWRNNVQLHLFLFLRVRPPPFTDVLNLNWQIVRIIYEILFADFFKHTSHVGWEKTRYRFIINSMHCIGGNCHHISWDKPIPKTEKLIRYMIGCFFTRFINTWKSKPGVNISLSLILNIFGFIYLTDMIIKGNKQKVNSFLAGSVFWVFATHDHLAIAIRRLLKKIGGGIKKVLKQGIFNIVMHIQFVNVMGNSACDSVNQSIFFRG